MDLDRSVAEQRVRVPAIGLILTGVVGGLFELLDILLSLALLLFPGLDRIDLGLEGHGLLSRAWFVVTSSLYGVISGLVGLALAGFLVFGGLKMMRLESHGIALAACILALIPCVSPCCLIGLPFGILGLVVINDPPVKQAFR